MKKALIVANLGGFVSFLISDIKILQNQGYEVIYAANANKLQWDDKKKELDDLGVQFVQIDFDSKKPLTKDNYVAYRQIKKLIHENHFDLIHVHTPISGLVTRLAAIKARKKGCKVIYTTHGLSYTSYSSKKSRFIYYILEDFCSRFTDAIITINKEDYQSVSTMHCKRYYYIQGMGVKTERFRNVDINRSEYRKSIGVAEDTTMVLAVGELSRRKNHQIILKALSELPNKSDYTYVICGSGVDGGTGMELSELAQKLDVKLQLLGFRYDIPAIMHCSDIGVLPSIREGLGFTGVQSLAAGVPVVGSNVQGIKDYIVDKKTGVLCHPNDLQAFKEGIVYLSDPEVREKMRLNCIQMSEKFDISVSESQRAAIYDEILLDRY